MLWRLMLLVLVATSAAAEPVVTARGLGYVTNCAEMDNVLVSLTGEDVREFTLRATHPAYHALIDQDITKADFTGCVFPKEKIYDFDPFSTVLYQDDNIQLKGHRLSKDWQPGPVEFVVGDLRISGLHLTQLLTRYDGDWIEILVLYPTDGYWRPKPLPPVGRAGSGYGSSILFGPIERDTRPLVRIKRVTFDPATLSYRLDFVRGGSAILRVLSVGQDELRLDVRFDRPVTGGPFAMLSSMHVTDDNSDVARLTVREPKGVFWTSIPIDTVTGVQGSEFAFGRDVPSRHNTSAPDMIFGPFR